MISFLLSLSSSTNKGTRSHYIIDRNLSFELLDFAQIKYGLRDDNMCTNSYL